MKILYIAAEHVSGTLSTLKAEHERRGDSCRFVTLWNSRWNFPDDICLNLPLMPDRSWVRGLRNLVADGPYDTRKMAVKTIKYWQPSFPIRTLFAIRDRLLWPRILRAIEHYQLNDFDIIQFDGGLDFTRDCRFANHCAARGKTIVCFYHGSDFRSRGLIRPLDAITDIRFSSEWDLLELDPRIEYLYLPFDTSYYPDRIYRPHSPVRICHAARNPLKGTTHVIAAVEKLKRDFPIELRLMQNYSYLEALRVKEESDIFVDQLTNAGGWGYGMSSVEALAMGMPVITNIPPQMQNQLGNHPFIQATPDSMESVLKKLFSDADFAANCVAHGQQWVRERHDVRKVGDVLYGHYQSQGWLNAH